MRRRSSTAGYERSSESSAGEAPTRRGLDVRGAVLRLRGEAPHGFAFHHTTLAWVEIVSPGLRVTQCPIGRTRGEDRVRGVCRLEAAARRRAEPNRGVLLLVSRISCRKRRRRPRAPDRPEASELPAQLGGPRTRDREVRRHRQSALEGSSPRPRVAPQRRCPDDRGSAVGDGQARSRPSPKVLSVERRKGTRRT